MARHTITLAVTVTAEGRYYDGAADLENHVSGWIYDALEDRDDLTERSVTDAPTLQAAANVTYAAAYRQAADEVEAETSAQYPGAIYGAIRRIRAYKTAAFLRRRADEIENGGA